MSLPDRLDQDLRAARPPDPPRSESDRAAVRILARLAVRDAGTAAQPAAPRHRSVVRIASIAAAVLVAVLAWPDASSPPSAPTPPTPEASIAGAPRHAAPEDPLRALAREAVAGDALARARLRDRGAEGRAALLALAAGGGEDASRALAVLRSFGALRGPREVERIAALAHRPELRSEAVALLGSDLGKAGAAHLGRLLASEPEAEPIVIAALERVARRGRRQAAIDALMQGVTAGRVAAAGAAVRLGGAAELRAVLDALPEGRVGDPALAAVVREGPRTLKRRALHLAARGDERALVLAARARLDGVVGMLAQRVASGDAERAGLAVGLLAEMRTAPAWVELGRARDGAAAAQALAALAQSPEATLDGVVHLVMRRPREAPGALAALGGAGAGGLDRLRGLARVPSVASAVVEAIGAAVGPGAAQALVELAGHPARRYEVVAALASRLEAGDEAAGSALLALARDGLERPVLRALAGCGEAGIRWLKEAEREPELRRRARVWLGRLVGAPSRSAASSPSAI
ncbi:MAG: hypothetical protein QNJ98_10080 [Planctomycetota bacterium]|nr:hypothetical protein [Planctomycetota bacterium]